MGGAVNAELTRHYLNLGQRLCTIVSGDARASCSTLLPDQLGQQLTQKFDRNFETRNLRRIVKIADASLNF